MLTTAQTWVLLGVLGTFVTGLLVAVSLATTSLRGEFRGLFEGQQGAFEAMRGEFRGLLDGLRGEMSARFDAVDTRFDAVDTRLDGVDRRLDHLDRDVQALSDRVFRDRP